MADVPVSIFTSKTVRAGQSPANPGFDQSGGTPVPVSPASPLSFLGLTDTPTSYVGQGGKTVAVKSDASGLEFVMGVGGAGASGQVAFWNGTSTQTGDSGLTFDSVTSRLRIGGNTTGTGALNLTGAITIKAVNNTFQDGFIQIRHNASDVLDAGMALESVKNVIVNVRLDLGGDAIQFYTASVGSTRVERWQINSIGQLIATGAQTIQTSTGNLALATAGGNGNILLSPHGSGLVMVGTGTPTNTLDVNGTTRIRTINNGVGYLLNQSATGVITGSANLYDAGDSILIGTINTVASHKLRISGGAINVTNWPTSVGAYDKLSIDFGEFRGIGYDPNYNEVFIAGTVTVPVKIDTDAPTDSLVINEAGNVSIGGQIHVPTNSKGNSGTGTVTFNWNDGNIQTVTLTGTCTFAFSNPQSGASYQIIITQDGTGGRTITWPSGIYWEGRVIPTLTGVANSRDIVTMTYDGTNYNALIARNFGT